VESFSLSLSLSLYVLENVCALCEQRRIMGKYQCPFLFLFCQCCNVVEVVMIHEMNKANMATNKKLKEMKRKKHPSILFTTQQKPKFSFSKTLAKFLSKK
jgi:hypothetical protein